MRPKSPLLFTITMGIVIGLAIASLSTFMATAKPAATASIGCYLDPEFGSPVINKDITEEGLKNLNFQYFWEQKGVLRGTATFTNNKLVWEGNTETNMLPDPYFCVMRDDRIYFFKGKKVEESNYKYELEYTENYFSPKGGDRYLFYFHEEPSKQ